MQKSKIKISLWLSSDLLTLKPGFIKMKTIKYKWQARKLGKLSTMSNNVTYDLTVNKCTILHWILHT